MKKKFYINSSVIHSLFTFTFLLFFTFYSQNAKACVDPDTIATLEINYIADLSQVEIRIGNLKLETADPNKFCACGLSSTTDVFSFVTYIAVVYQGTNDVYPNFIPFMQSGPADDAWDGSQPTFPNWNGYVADVINGLVVDDAVELIIRAQPPAGVLVELEQSPQNDTNGLFWQTYLGTDEWDNNVMDLMEDHQAIRTFAFMENLGVNVKPQSHFDELDHMIVSAYEAGKAPVQVGKLTPNPVTDYFELSFELLEATDLTLVIYSVTGKEVHRVSSQRFNSGKHTKLISLEGILRKSGIYIASLQSSSGQNNFKFFKL